MAHRSVLVRTGNQPLLQRHGTQGVIFRIRCCADPVTDEVHHIMRAAQFTREELLLKIQREYLEPHAAGHEAAEKLFATVEQDLSDCPGCQ
jgi:hypothetical protein